MVKLKLALTWRIGVERSEATSSRIRGWKRYMNASMRRRPLELAAAASDRAGRRLHDGEVPIGLIRQERERFPEQEMVGQVAVEAVLLPRGQRQDLNVDASRSVRAVQGDDRGSLGRLQPLLQQVT